MARLRREHDSRGRFALHHLRARAREEWDGMLRRREVDPARRERGSKKRKHPFLRPLSEEPEGGEPHEAELACLLRFDAAEHFGDRLQPGPAVSARDGGEHLLYDERRLLAALGRGFHVARVVEGNANVAVTTAADELVLVAEVTKDEVVTAAPR